MKTIIVGWLVACAEATKNNAGKIIFLIISPDAKQGIIHMRMAMVIYVHKKTRSLAG
ncbi:hypothetical protein CSC18_2559 [Klebsiella aerogenes]|nr:hypothetical protein CSC18_2559 [Klebsiella aerogenes]